MKKEKKIAVFVLTIIVILLGLNNVSNAASNDATLKSISISPTGNGLKQDEDNSKIYRVKVENNVNSITVNAVTNDPKATVSVTGNTGLQVGTNKVNVLIKAEDGTTASYIIYVRRSDESIAEQEIVPNVTENTTDENKEQNNESNNSNQSNEVVEQNVVNETVNEENSNETQNISENRYENQSASNGKDNTKIYTIAAAIVAVIVIGAIFIVIKKK